MVSLALGFAGAAIGGAIGGTVLGVGAATIGGFIGSKIGGLIDNILFPTKVEGPRLSDLSVQASSYGKPIPRLYGPECPIAGNIIWSSGLIETAQKQGKGGPQVTNYTYRTSLAVLLGDRVGLDPIKGVKKIWANGKLIFNTESVSSGGVAGATPIGEVWDGATFTALDFFQAAQSSHAVFDTITVYPGDFEQLPDPTIESYMGAGEVPGYRGSAYIVIKDLQLADYGNRIPNLVFLVEADEAITTGQVSRDILTLCGMDMNRVSTILLNDDVRGYTIGTSTDGVSGLQPLALGFNFDACDVGGDIRFTPRDQGIIAVIPTNDLGAFAYGEKVPDEAVQWTRGPETTLPREAAVTFLDPEMDYQNNTATARRAAGNAQNNLTAQLPITSDVDLGQRTADRLLWEAWNKRHAATAQINDKWHFVQAGKKYAFTTPAGLEPLRVLRRTRGDNGIIDLGLARDRVEVYHSRNTGAAGSAPISEVSLPGDTELLLLDIPIMRDVDDDAGFYYAVGAPSTGWRGADVLRALDIAGEFDEVAPMGVRSAIGDITGTVPAGVTPGDATSAFAFDDVTVIRVTLHDTRLTLESVDDEAIFAGANACFIGNPADTTYGETLQYGVATLIAPGVYDLSHLYRGRQGTEFAVSLHGSGEIFVKLEANAMKRANYGVGDLNLERVYKGVSLLTSQDDADAQYFTNTGVGLRPWSPHVLYLTGVEGGDLTLNWTRRSRLESGVLGEATELYTVRIMSADGLSILREEQVTTPTFVYREPMQVEDFGGAVSSLRWRVAQVSATFGNGIFAEFIGDVEDASSGESTGTGGTITEVGL